MADELIRLDKAIVGIDVLITKAETAAEANGLFKAKDIIYSQQRYFTDVQPVNRWISCKDKMPEEYKTVLVYEKDYGVMIGELEKKFFDTQYFIARKSGLILRTTEVTHWQPLPEPPKQ